MNHITRPAPVVLQTGFRIFFLGAAMYAVVSMAVWMVFYVLQGNVFVAMPLTVWHGHEMIFGFTMAVVAGFLLTAVTNWTGLPTLQGGPLLILFLLWLAARILAFMPASVPLWPLVVSNIAFLIFLSYAVIRPIAAVKQWKQSAVFSKLLLVLAAAVVFYVAFFNDDLIAERKALRFAVYMMISLILTIGRRVIPFFIERGVGYPVTLRNDPMLDRVSLVLLVLFSLIDVFMQWPWVVIALSLLLSVIHILRLAGWNTPGIWKKPLLWILFVGYVFVIAGFVLKALTLWLHHPDDVALHAWTAGGIGIFTIGMMARVAWGHTGRLIADAPKALPVIFALIMASAVVRTCGPLVMDSKYILWIGISQTLWMLAFVLYLVIYYPILVSPRFDGKEG